MSSAAETRSPNADKLMSTMRRHGRLSVKRLLARYGPDAAVRNIMQEQIGFCLHRNDTQLQPKLRSLGRTLIHERPKTLRPPDRTFLNSDAIAERFRPDEKRR